MIIDDDRYEAATCLEIDQGTEYICRTAWRHEPLTGSPARTHSPATTTVHAALGDTFTTTYATAQNLPPDQHIRDLA